MAPDEREVKETIYVTKGLLASAFLSNLIVSIILFSVLGGMVFSYRNPQNPLYEHSTFWAALAASSTFLFSTFFLWPKHDRRKNAITFIGNTFQFRSGKQLVEVKLQPTSQVITKRQNDCFSLTFVDPVRGEKEDPARELVIRGRGDSDWQGVDRLFARLQPHLVLNWELFQILSMARLDGKPLSAQAELMKAGLGEVLFTGTSIQQSLLQNKKLSRVFFGAFLLCGLFVGAVTQDSTRAVLATVLGFMVSLLFTVALEFYRRKNLSGKGPVLLGTRGIGFGESSFPSAVVPYDAFLSLGVRKVEHGEKRHLEIAGRTLIGSQLKIELEFESPEHLAQLEQAIQDAQPKLGTPTAKEERSK